MLLIKGMYRPLSIFNGMRGDFFSGHKFYSSCCYFINYYRKVAMKVIRNSQRYIHAAKTEIAILQKIAKHDDGMRFVSTFSVAYYTLLHTIRYLF